MQDKSRMHEVTHLSGANSFRVISGTSGEVYVVTIIDEGEQAYCTCKWGQYRDPGEPSACSHVIAVQNYISQQEGYKAYVWPAKDDALRQHRKIVDLGDGAYLTLRKFGS